MSDTLDKKIKQKSENIYKKKFEHFQELSNKFEKFYNSEHIL
jgi:hypothetical protein